MDVKKRENMNQEEAYCADFKTWTAQPRKNYGGTYGINGEKMPIYTKKQMKSLYPSGGYEVAAEYAPGTEKSGSGVLRVGELALPLGKYRSNNRVLYWEKGFVAIDAHEDVYVAVLSRVFTRRTLVLLLCLLVLAGGTITVLGLRDNEAVPAGTSAVSAPELESGAVDWEGIKVSEPENTPADGIRIPGFKSITIQADTTEVSVNLQNPEQNNCYFVIRLVLLDTQETLYESKMIEPGKGLYTITLSRALEAGTYPAQLQYEPYDLSTLTRLNGAVINLSLIAE